MVKAGDRVIHYAKYKVRAELMGEAQKFVVYRENSLTQYLEFG